MGAGQQVTSVMGLMLFNFLVIISRFAYFATAGAKREIIVYWLRG